MATAPKMKPAKVSGKHEKREAHQPHAAAAPVQSPELNSAEASDLSTEWPSLSFGPVLADVLEHLKRADGILRSAGFLLVVDPVNPLGDARTWVLSCEPTGNMPAGTDLADSARRRLESEGVKVHEVYKLDQCDGTFEVVLSPPSRPVTRIEVPRSEAEKLQSERLQKGYQINDAGSPIPSNRAIEEDYVRAHNGPSMEYVLGEAWKRAKASVHTTAPEAAKEKMVPSAKMVKVHGRSRGNKLSVEDGKLVDGYNKDLQRLARIGRSRLCTEKELKEKCPELQIWEAIERSLPLSQTHRKEFFERPLMTYNVEERFAFIGKIYGVSGSHAYNWYKAYRASAGVQNRRLTKRKKTRALINS